MQVSCSVMLLPFIPTTLTETRRGMTEELRERGADVVLMIQADMLAYHVPGEPPQLGLSDPALSVFPVLLSHSPTACFESEG